MARFDGTSAHQDAALPFGHAADDEAWVFIVNVAACAANVSGKAVADGYDERDAGAASNTKLNHNNSRAFYTVDQVYHLAPPVPGIALVTGISFFALRQSMWLQ